MNEKQVYLYDTNKKFVGSKTVQNDYELGDGETFVEPIGEFDGDIIFNGINWNGSNAEPTQEQQAINVLGQQVASLTVDVAALKKAGV